ncbi:MAG: PQQ-binding-like beta-propeller repeat protein [Williamsia herbipolensis]|nr:PQQ-binding-like beta-propeller repeat protein [Williamsia herbipolensis]
MSSRMRWLAGLTAGVVALGIAVSAASAAPAPSPWLQPGFNGAASNDNPTESTLTPSTVASLGLQQQLTVPGRNKCTASGPGVAVSESYVYAVDGTRLDKFSLYKGTEVWSVRADKLDNDLYRVAITHGLAIVSGTECGTSDPNAYVSAFDTTTGKHVWTINADGDGIDGLSFSGKYFATYTPRGAETTPLLHVFSVQTGKEIWSTPGGQSANLCGVGNSIVHGLVFETVCTGGDAGHPKLRALDLATGKTVWTRAGNFTVQRGDDDTAAGSHLYVTNPAGKTVDLDPATGATQARLAGAGPVVAVGPSQAYASCGDDLCAYSTATGKLVWTSTVADTGSGAVVAGDVVYLGSGVALNAATGKKVADVPAGPVAVGSGHLVTVDGAKSQVDVYGI